jgi:predicted membrane chloride channel (bestrophin family)
MLLEYNAARPFHVIGGISDKEAELLRNARGSSAKVALVYLWINEFMTREHIHGSMGTVAAPIISRLMQYASDGHMWYNAARKMAYIPFPFPHVQLTTAFIFSTIFVVPLLMLAKTNVYFGFVLNFLVVSILTGLNEIAKELQNPFTNVPNDLPLNLFQAHFNEALVTIFSGFHPDAYWELKESA